ncbi:MAG: molecular chaperone TorD family protein [Pseudomonadales bacterium]|nr:molecular chaperone TorD family protein [Pseudomonadales bacterium]
MIRLDLAAAARTRLYELLARPFEFPEVNAVNGFIDGSWGREVNEVLASLELAPADPALQLDVDAESFEIEFIRLFEVGLGGAPCPLHSGYHKRDRMKDLEEVVRFYRFFDYDAQRTADKFPDHLAFELNFMAHLTRHEAGSGSTVESLRRAQYDFLERHLVHYLPRLVRGVDERSEIGFVRDMAGLAQRFIAEDLAALRQEVQVKVQNA